MKRIFLSAVSLAVLTGSALAADLPSRKEAPVIAPPPPMWTGFYAGLNAGYSWGTNTNAYTQNWGQDTSGSVTAAAFNVGPIAMDGVISNTQSGFMGGAQFGYNYQYGSNIVIGIEADIQGANVRGSGRSSGLTVGNVTITNGNPQVSTSTNNIGSTRIQAGLDYLGTLRGRIGYIFAPSFLLYGTGGFAYGGAWSEVVQTAFTNGTTSFGGSTFPIAPIIWNGAGQQNQILTGWTAGAGAEWMFMPNWSLKAEALYWDLGRMNINTASYSSEPTNIGWGRSNVNYSGIVARAGVNYHFNFSAPVVAKF